jgi:hypothetical protein
MASYLFRTVLEWVLFEQHSLRYVISMWHSEIEGRESNLCFSVLLLGFVRSILASAVKAPQVVQF